MNECSKKINEKYFPTINKENSFELTSQKNGMKSFLILITLY